jgi:hypothetical protein
MRLRAASGRHLPKAVWSNAGWADYGRKVLRSNYFPICPSKHTRTITIVIMMTSLFRCNIAPLGTYYIENRMGSNFGRLEVR